MHRILCTALLLTCLAIALMAPTGLFAQQQDNKDDFPFSYMLEQEVVLAGFATCTNLEAARELGRDHVQVTKGNCYGVDYFVHLVIKEILYTNGQKCGLNAILRVQYSRPWEIGLELRGTQFMVVVNQDLGPYCHA